MIAAMSISFCLFKTPIGACGLAWGDGGIVALQLPEASDERTRARLLKRFPGAGEAAPPAEVRGAIAAIVALTSGEARDLGAIRLLVDGHQTLAVDMIRSAERSGGAIPDAVHRTMEAGIDGIRRKVRVEAFQGSHISSADRADRDAGWQMSRSHVHRLRATAHPNECRRSPGRGTLRPAVRRPTPDLSSLG